MTKFDIQDIPDNLSKADFLKYLSVIIGLMKKVKTSSEEKGSEIETKLEELRSEISDALNTIELKKGDKGEKGDKGDKGDPGEAGRDGRDGRDGKDGAKGDQGEPGKDADEEKIVSQASEIAITEVLAVVPTIDDLKNDIPKLGEPIRDALELLPEGEKLKIDAIEELRDELEKLKKAVKERQVTFVGGSSGGGKNVYLYSLSSQLNGVTKTFSIPAFWRIISVSSSSFPNAFEPDTDYTVDVAASTITFTSQINASSTLAAGQTLLVQYAN